MRKSLLFSFLVLVSVNGICADTPDLVENPLVADTFTRKKKIDRFANYQTVAINHLGVGAFQAEFGSAVVIQKVVAESKSSSPSVFSVDSSASGFLQGMSLKYGLIEHLNIESDLTYVVNSKSESTTTVSGSPSDSSDKKSGIQDLKLRGQFAMGFDSFGIATEAIFIPSIGKASSNSQSEESNAYREQSSLAIRNYLVLGGPQMKWGSIQGFSYAFNGEVESISTSGAATTKEVSGGNVFTAGGFFEFPGFYFTNLQLLYEKQNSITKTTASGSATDYPALDYLDLLAAMKFDITKKVNFIPQFQYTTILNKDANQTFSYTQVDLFGLSGTIRVLF